MALVEMILALVIGTIVICIAMGIGSIVIGFIVSWLFD